MNKSHLVEHVLSTNDDVTTKAGAERVVSAVIGAISTGLKKTGSVQIVGFGTFTVRKRAARTGRNPQTGEAMRIKATKTVGFKAGKGLKDTVASAKITTKVTGTKTTTKSKTRSK